MIIDEKVYYFKNGEMKLLSRYRYINNMEKMKKLMVKWYTNNPYSKRLNGKWICGDYRIDQQRPQRNVYSEKYLEIISISEMEKEIFDKIIEENESKINYPTVYDDGKNRYYEDTIHCPRCGKRRKVLTSKTHCEHCGFSLKETKKCPNCKDLSLKNSDFCNHCGYDFNEKERKEKEEMIKPIKCPKCEKIKSEDKDYCEVCNFNFGSKKQCPHCETWVDNEDKYCMNCGNKLNVLKKCSCGKKNKIGQKYCSSCGKKL